MYDVPETVASKLPHLPDSPGVYLWKDREGRVLYVGRLAKGTSITRELLIPLSPQAAMALRGATIDLSIELRDAHATAPATPIRFQGAVLGDAPR